MEGTNNHVELCGSPAGRPDFSHAGGGEDFFTFPLEIERLSGACDRINIIARGSTLRDLEIAEDGASLSVTGELRSYNNKRGEGSRLVITALARELSFSGAEHKNIVELAGVLCKKPTLRRTPMGRQICDLMLAAPRRYGRSDYLPCIAWGRLAEEASELDVGDRIALEGRIQSRKYIKAENGEPHERTAFEISIVTMDTNPE